MTRTLVRYHVYSSGKRSEKIDYMHKNPFRRGLVKDYVDWPWSSYRHYATGERGTVAIESGRTAARRNRATP